MINSSLNLCLRPHSISPLNQSASTVTQNLEATLANYSLPPRRGLSSYNKTIVRVKHHLLPVNSTMRV